jgi:hypothetical protein
VQFDAVVGKPGLQGREELAGVLVVQFQCGGILHQHLVHAHSPVAGRDPGPGVWPGRAARALQRKRRPGRAAGAAVQAQGTGQGALMRGLGRQLVDGLRRQGLQLMQIPYELALGWRYTRAGRATRRNGFISFISGVSMLGIALGVAALIIVLSVMNGFQKEVRDRMLSVVSHIEIYAPQGGAALPDLAARWPRCGQPAGDRRRPLHCAQALLARGEDMKGALVRGIDPALEPAVTDLAGS